MIATTSGLVAYTGVKLGASQTAEFTPVASYPGLTADVRARLGEMKVAPVSAEMVAANAPLPETARDVVLPATSVPKAVATRAKRAEVDWADEVPLGEERASSRASRTICRAQRLRTTPSARPDSAARRTAPGRRCHSPQSSTLRR